MTKHPRKTETPVPKGDEVESVPTRSDPAPDVEIPAPAKVPFRQVEQATEDSLNKP